MMHCAALMINRVPPSTIQQITPIWKALSSLSPLSVIVASIDGSIKSDLEASHALWFSLLIAATVLVFLGVVLEEAEGWVPYLNKILSVKEITEYRLIKRLAKLGWILIVIGVLGEGVFEVLVYRVDNRLHQFDEASLNEARREAGNAAESAKSAHGEADAVKTEADAIDKRLQVASSQLATAEAKLAWRSVSNEQKKILKVAVRAMRGRKIDLTWDGADPEQDAFGPQLARALRNAELIVDAGPASINIPPAETGSTGILIEGDDEEFSEWMAKSLVLAHLARRPVSIFPVHINGARIQIRIRPKGL